MRTADGDARGRSRANEISLRLMAGESSDCALVLRAGLPVAPISVGLGARWRIDARGVAPLHFFICFDGDELFAAAALGVPKVMVGTKRLPTRWVRLPSTGDIAFGEARILICAASASSQSVALDATRPRPGGLEATVATVATDFRSFASEETDEAMTLVALVPDAIRASASEDEEDCHARADDVHAYVGPNARTPDDAWEGVTPVSGSEGYTFTSLGDDPPDHSDVTMINPLADVLRASLPPPIAAKDAAPEPAAAPSEPTEPQVVPSPPSPPLALGPKSASLPARWSRVSIARKACVVALPVALIAAAAALLPPRGVKAAPPTQSHAKALPLPSAHAGATAAKPNGRAEVPASAAPSGYAVEEAAARLRARNDSTANGKTLARRATDAVSAGAFVEAGFLYDRLASGSPGPEGDVYREGARIARRKGLRAP